MPVSSSITNFSATAGTAHFRQRHFLGRLGWFAAPYAVVLLIAGLGLALSGEIIPAGWVARLHARGYEFLYLPAFTDHNYQLKLQAARLMRPDVLVIGGSRVNQFRRRMFGTTSSYNACQILYGQEDYRRFLEDLGKEIPKTIIFSLDFYTFKSDYGKVFQHVSYEDLSLWRDRELAVILNGIGRNPEQLAFLAPPRDPVSGGAALGLQAAKTGNGFRTDGSYQYGLILRGMPNSGAVTKAAGVERVRQGAVPFIPAAHLGEKARAELKRFAEDANRKGIRLIAITTPLAPEVVDALDESPDQGAWREFNSPEFGHWVAALGIKHFNFARIESFAGRKIEFIDAFHASETAYDRMMLQMLRDPAFRALVPGADLASIEGHMPPPGQSGPAAQMSPSPTNINGR
jgi:hypothetical protein